MTTGIDPVQGKGFVHPVTFIFDELQALVDAKAADYAAEANVFSNFEGAAHLTGLTVDNVFHVMIAIKVERLRNLTERGTTPNFESLEDTLMDLANYTALWLAFKKQGVK